MRGRIVTGHVTSATDDSVTVWAGSLKSCTMPAALNRSTYGSAARMP